jgi:hypothetical protein
MWKDAERAVGKLTAKTKAAIAEAFEEKENPPKGWFNRCVRAVTEHGGAVDPNAVCGAAERKNPRKGLRGLIHRARPAKKARMIRHKIGRGKKLPNPVEAAARRFEVTHGRPPDEVFEVIENERFHTVLPAYGRLEWLKILAIGDGRTVVKLGGFEGAMLAENEKADEQPQLFIVGGDQSVEVGDFGIDTSLVHEQEVLGAVTEVAYKTRKDHLGSAGAAGERATHVHDFGSKRSMEPNDPRRKKGSRLPLMIYDVRNRGLKFAGGGYDLPEVGIRG